MTREEFDYIETELLKNEILFFNDNTIYFRLYTDAKTGSFMKLWLSPNFENNLLKSIRLILITNKDNYGNSMNVSKSAFLQLLNIYKRKYGEYSYVVENSLWISETYYWQTSQKHIELVGVGPSKSKYEYVECHINYESIANYNESQKIIKKSIELKEKKVKVFQKMI